MTTSARRTRSDIIHQYSAPIVFLHGRPAGHPFHAQLAESAGAVALPSDFFFPYMDATGSRLRKYLSWAACSLFFPNRRALRAVLTESLRLPGPLMRVLHLLRDDQPV